jgi:hypothetical protein
LGSADVTTPASYLPGSAHPVTIGFKHLVATADASGQLHVIVPLGKLGPVTTHVAIA